MGFGLKAEGSANSAIVEFVSVSVRYRPGLPLVLRGLSFVVRRGERVGVIGRTGCGKSTLTLCLFRLLEIEADGKVLLHGVDVKEMRTTTLRRAIAVVPQVPLIYAGSLRANLDPLEEASEQRLWDVLEYVELADFAKHSEDGLDLTVAESGANMS